MLENVVISINNRPFEHWKYIELDYSLNRIFSSCSFEAPENPQLRNTLWIPDSIVRVTSNGRVIFTGNIFRHKTLVRDSNVTTRITCRSFGAILSDSSLFNSTDQNIDINETIDQYAERLIKPFNVDFQIKTNPLQTSKNIRYKLSNSLSTPERELLNGMSSMSAGSFTAKTEGGVKIYTNEAYEQSGSAISNSIKVLDFEADDSQRFYKYETIATSSAREATVDAIGVAFDTSVTNQLRVRRRRVIGDNFDQSNLKDFSEWQKNTAYGRSRRLRLEVVGWRPFYNVQNPGEDGSNFQNLSLDLGSEFFLPGQIHRLSESTRIAQRVKIANNEPWLLNTVLLKQTNVDDVARQGGTEAILNFVKPEIYVNEPRQFREPEIVGNTGDVSSIFERDDN